MTSPPIPPPDGPVPPASQPTGEFWAQPRFDRRLKLVNSPTLFRWLLGGRILLAVSALTQAYLNRAASPEFAVAGLVIVALGVMVTLYGGYVSLAQRERPTLWHLRMQAVMDLLLVTVLVHFAGSHQTGWVALYVLVIAIYGLIMPLRSGLFVALFGAAIYLADAYYGLGNADASPGLWGQVAVFTIVFLVVAGLGQRLRTAAAEQTQLETQLERVRLEADEILRNIRSGVVNVDGRGMLAFINPTAEQLLEIDARVQLGRPVLGLLATRAPELHDAIVAGVERGHRVARAEGAVHRNGRSFPIGLSTTTFEREGDQAPSVTAIFTDISDLQYLEELHLRTERLEAVAALGASMAHEIRNPLASIRSAVEQLAHAKREDPDERILAELILRESDRLSRLLGEFLDFSRVRASRFQPVNLASVIQDAARMVQEHPDCHPGVEIATTGSSLLLQGDEDLLHRIFWNLLLNAAQAMTSGGRIEIAVDQPDPSELPRGAEFEHPARIRIVDDGPGIDPELLERLFQPFVSGRPGGSGLGLAIVQRAVEAHRGLVLVDSAPGAGTTFTILLHTKWPTEEAA
ncbi:MAG: ATP-binding protein [Gemmatimonadales bacterium]